MRDSAAGGAVRALPDYSYLCPMKFIKRLAGDSLVYGLSTVVPRALNYVLVVLHSRVFLPPEYGVITELYAYMAILLVVLTFGMENGYFRFSKRGEREQNPGVYSTLFWFLAATSGLFFALCWLFAPELGKALGYQGGQTLLLLTAAIIAIDTHSTIIFAKIREQGKALRYCRIKIGSVVIIVGLNLIFLLLLPALGFYRSSFGVGYVLLANLLGSLYAWLAALRFTGGLPKGFSRQQLVEILGYSLPLVLAGMGGTTNEYLDRFFIRWLTPAPDSLAEVGIYGANVKIAVLLTMVVQMYRYAAEPYFLPQSTDERDKPQRLGLSTRLFLHTSLFIAAGIMLALPWLQYLVGREFRCGLDVIPALLCANVLYGFYFNVSLWFKIQKRTWYALLLVSVGMAVTVGLNLLLTPRISYHGAAWARVGCYAVMTALCIWLSIKHYSMPYLWRRYLQGLLCTGGALLLGLLPLPSQWLMMLWRALVMAALLLLLLRVEGINGFQLAKRWLRK